MTPLGVAVVLVAPVLSVANSCFSGGEPTPPVSPVPDDLVPMREFVMQPLFSINASDQESDSLVFSAEPPRSPLPVFDAEPDEAL